MKRSGTMAESTSPLRIVEESSAYWRVVFDYPPFNVMDVTMFQSLQDLLARMDASQTLRVVVFESAIPDFYLAHFDLTGKLGNVMSGVGLLVSRYFWIRSCVSRSRR